MADNQLRSDVSGTQPPLEIGVTTSDPPSVPPDALFQLVDKSDLCDQACQPCCCISLGKPPAFTEAVPRERRESLRGRSEHHSPRGIVCLWPVDDRVR
jgi:hypothetical protein